jgi:multisubunit Na+/H+ antiporter MnhG subunit
MRAAIVSVLLFAGLGLELFCCAGVLLMRGALARLHYAGATTLGVLLIAAAVVVRESFSLIGSRAILVAAFFLVASPVLTHTTARALRAGARK